MDNEKYEVELEINTKAFNKQCEQIENSAERVSDFVERVFKEKNVQLFTEVPEGDKKHLKILQTEYLHAYGKLQDKFEKIEKPTEKQTAIFDALSKVYNQNLDFIEEGLNNFKEQEEEASEEADNIGKNAGKSKNKFALFFKTMEKGFDKGFKKVKRFTLGLLGVRSAYFAMNKAMGQYLQNDQELSDKLQSIWTGLGVIIAPLIELVANQVLKLTKYTLYIAKILTGEDLLQKAIDKTDKKMTKSLSSLDEITNVSEQSNLATLADMLDKVEIDTEWADKLARAIQPIYDTLHGIVDFAIEHPEIIAVILGGWATVSLIGTIIGAGTTGLYGIAFVLGLISAKNIWDAVNAMIELNKQHKDYLEMTKGNLEADKELNEKIREAQSRGEMLPGSEEAERMTRMTKGNIRDILGQIEEAESHKKWYNFWRWDEIDKEVGNLQEELKSAYERLELLNGKKIDIEYDVKVNYKNGILPFGSSGSSISGGGFRGVNSYDVGTNYVPNDQLAMVHEGEAIVPKKFNSQEYFGNDQETKDMLFEIIDLLRESSDKVPVFNMDSREFARATYEAYQNEGKRLGVNTSVERS